MKTFFTVFFLLTATLSAQIPLKIVLPESDTTRYAFSKHRVAGSTRPDCRVFIDGTEAQVNSIGAFIGMVEVPEGTSQIRFVARDANGDSTVKVMTMIRPARATSTPRDPLTIEKRMMLPSENLWLGTNDVLEVRFKGSPGYQATFDIEDIESGIPMRELTTKEANGVEGIYVGRYIIKDGDETHDTPVRFKLKKSFWSSEKAVSKATVTITTRDFPRVVELKGKRPYLNIGLGDDRLGGAKLGFVPSGVRVKVSGKFGDQYRVQLSPVMTAYLPEENATLLPSDTPLPRALSGNITINGNATEDNVNISLGQKLAYTTEQVIHPAAIVVNIYGATSNTNWITHMTSATNIEQVVYRQAGTEQLQVTIYLKDQQHWGHDVTYDGSSLKIKIRKAPVVADTTNPLSGLTIVIDAGHGGDNNGALSSTGGFEKDVNLSITRHLDEILKSKGVKAVMTRDSDVNPSMGTRIDSILSSNAQILVSIHNNSIGETSDAGAVKGTSAYWRYPGFKTLADILYGKMLETGLSEYGKTGSFNFSLNAPTQLVNVLVEGAFMSNPDDELKLLDDNFRTLVAQKIASGLEEFMLKYGARK
jgi:N-acetylmuramoyl-L-alanine amidase